MDDIKFLGATSLVFGLDSGIISLMMGSFAISVYCLIKGLDGRVKALPFIPFIFVGIIPILIIRIL